MYSILGLFPFVDNSQIADKSFLLDLLLNRVVKNGPKDYTLLVASANTTQPSAVHEIDAAGAKATLKVQYGDFSSDLTKVSAALKEVSISWAPTHRSLLMLIMNTSRQ